jgi:hypothetical protein
MDYIECSLLGGYQISQYVVPHSGIFLGKCRSVFAGNSDGKMNVQSACALNTRYNEIFATLRHHPQCSFNHCPLTPEAGFCHSFNIHPSFLA